MKKRYSFIFLIVWGLLFGGIPLTILILHIKNGFKDFAFLLVFAVIGMIAVVYGLVQMTKTIRDAHILKHGKEGVGNFITSIGAGSMNNVPIFKIEFEFANDKNEVIQSTTNEYYTFDEVEIFRNLEQLSVKYIGSKAVLNSKQPFKKTIKTKSTQQLPENKQKTVCAYCGTEYVGEKCSNCGASANKK